MPRYVRIAMLGAKSVGKSSLMLQFMYSVFVEQYDPTIEDGYRKTWHMSEINDVVVYEFLDLPAEEDASRFIIYAEWSLLCVRMSGDASQLAADIAYVEAAAAVIRQRKGLGAEEPLPAFVVGTQADPPRISGVRPQLVDLAARLKAQAYYETSAKRRMHVDEVMHDAARQIVATQVARDVRAADAAMPSLAPWNWGKRVKWEALRKRLEFEALNTSALPTAAKAVAVSELVAEESAPEVRKNPVAYFNDMRKLLTNDGAVPGDILLLADGDAEPITAHRIVLFLRSEYFRKILARYPHPNPRVTVPGLTARQLNAFVAWLYTDQMPAGLDKPALEALREALQGLSSADAANVATKRTISESAVVQQQTQSLLTMPEFFSISDVEFAVGASRQKFRLHRAVLWARSEWFRALLERWSHENGNERDATKSKAPLEVHAMTGDVFGCVVEFLYTGRAGIADELALDVLVAADMLRLPRLVQLAELALQPVIDAGNAVPVYLAAEAHGAKQLAAACEYCMARAPTEAARHEQWVELSAEVRARVQLESERMRNEAAVRQKMRTMVQKMPCLLCPP